MAMCCAEENEAGVQGYFSVGPFPKPLTRACKRVRRVRAVPRRTQTSSRHGRLSSSYVSVLSSQRAPVLAVTSTQQGRGWLPQHDGGV